MLRRRRGLVVLSLFDGISAGQLALKRAGIIVDKYYASEVDKHAIQITQQNFPNTIQLGDVRQWRDWDIEKPDIIIGGSPCTDLSFAGSRKGLSTTCKQDVVTLEDYLTLQRQDFDFSGQSYLFWEYIAIRQHYAPKYFFLENVMFVKKWRDIFNEALGFEPTILNSALVSAQNRVRQYFFGIRNAEGGYDPIEVSEPEDKGILLRDVVLDDALFVGRVVGRRLDENGTRKDYSDIPAKQRLELRTDGRSGTITTVQKDNMVLTKKGYTVCMHNLYGGFGEKEHRTFLDKSPTLRTAAGGGHIPSLLLSEKALAYMDRKVRGGRTHWDFAHHSDVRNAKSAAVVANFFKGVPYNVLKDENCIRYFHPVECEALQTFPMDYTAGISKTQRYRSLGNSWTVDIIVHIFNHMKVGRNGV